MATIMLPSSSVTERFIDAIATAWEFFKTAGQIRETFDSLASSARGVIPVVASERRTLEAVLAGGVPSHRFGALAGRSDQLAIHAKKLLEIRGELERFDAFSQRDLKVFDDLAAEVTALHKLYAAVLQADQSLAPAEFWEQADEAAKGPFEDGGEILARLQGGGEI